MPGGKTQLPLRLEVALLVLGSPTLGFRPESSELGTPGYLMDPAPAVTSRAKRKPRFLLLEPTEGVR